MEQNAPAGGEEGWLKVALGDATHATHPHSSTLSYCRQIIQAFKRLGGKA